jgi:hypothetical protein
VGDAGVEEHAVATQLHGDRHVAGRAHAGIDDDGIVRIAALGRVLEALQDHDDGGRVGDAPATANGAAGRHDAGGPGVADPGGHDRIVTGVAHDREAVGHELPACFQRADGIGQQRLLVAEDLELHPVLAGIVQLVQ